MATCVRCSGSGVVMMPAADWGIPEGLPVPCPACNGTGVSAIVPVSPVRADREAVVEALLSVDERLRLADSLYVGTQPDDGSTFRHLYDADAIPREKEYWVHLFDCLLTGLGEDDLMIVRKPDALRATPEPERAG